MTAAAPLLRAKKGYSLKSVKLATSLKGNKRKPHGRGHQQSATKKKEEKSITRK